MHKGAAHGAFPGRGLPVTKHENNYHDADRYTKPDSRAASWKDVESIEPTWLIVLCGGNNMHRFRRKAEATAEGLSAGAGAT